MKSALITITILSLSVAMLRAEADGGSPGPIEDPACAVPFSGSVSFGYESEYVFRGASLGDNAPWASFDISFDFIGDTTIDAGTWYINPTSGDQVVNDELDVYAFLNFPLLVFDAYLGAVWYYYPEDSGQITEADFGLSYLAEGLPLFGDVEFSFLTAFDEDASGWYFEYQAGKAIPLTDCLELDLSSGISHGHHYYGVDGINHLFALAGLNYTVTESALVNLYVGGNFVELGGDLEDLGEDNDVHGGISLTVSF